MPKQRSKRLLRSLLVLPCLLGILAFSPLFANSRSQAATTHSTIIAAGGGTVIPQMPGPNK